ncbi:unnamed protein product [Ilex paraguariensis]|uniref:THH1/TOM1/TOM3 domain-containing protein n=1 Tax=Ilex paraguariensis TaxID=185542 RepID=A0ABC8UL42_9AQUA
MACPKILFLAAFLLLLSFWVDLCHQANDEEDEDEGCSSQEALLDKTNRPQSNTDSHRKCCSFRCFRIGSRQRVVILVTVLVFMLMMASAVLIWIGMGKNSIDSSVVARVYVDLFAIAVLLLGGALASYGLVLFLKMGKVRSERAASEMWKVAGLAIVSVLCFTSSAFVALFTKIPVLYHWPQQEINDVRTSLLLIVYYFIGSSVPSAFVLWVMRELPASIVVNSQEESRTIAFISDSSMTLHPQRWTAATSLQNQRSFCVMMLRVDRKCVTEFPCPEFEERSSVPSAFVLWVMRELPASIVVNSQEESRTIAFISDSSMTLHPQRWTAATSLQNQLMELIHKLQGTFWGSGDS